jgi:hypothetical protein
MKYGPTFRNMTELLAEASTNYGVIKVLDTKFLIPKQFEFPYVVHLATLDSVLHPIFPSISGEEDALSEAVVPNFSSASSYQPTYQRPRAQSFTAAPWQGI